MLSISTMTSSTEELIFYRKILQEEFYRRTYIVNLSDLCKAMEKILDKIILCYRHFKAIDLKEINNAQNNI